MTKTNNNNNNNNKNVARNTATSSSKMKRKRTARNTRQIKPYRGFDLIEYFPERNSIGRATVKTAFEATVSNTVSNLAIGYLGFNTWSAKTRNLLTPFSWFRINGVRLYSSVVGGASSPLMMYVSVARDTLLDNSITAVLDDENSIATNGSNMGIVELGPEYWKQRNTPWYVVSDTGSTTDCVAGCITYVVPLTTGYAAGTVGGYISVELDLEFHTMT